jgi:oxygen-independent coproporphyrinogen-3 oxidase
VAKCRYCDFYSKPIDQAGAARYVDCVLRELDARRGELARGLASIFIGGGTPTSLGLPMLGKLLAGLSPLAGPGCEFSVEANPGTIDQRLSDAMARAGVNRVSLGAQSFEASELELLGRIHTAKEVSGAAAVLEKSGIENFGLDLMYGIPGQSLQTWRSSLRQALDLGPRHLSCYAVSFEAGTPLRADLDAGTVSEMDEGLQKECYYAAIETAVAAGLEHYEISNFAAKGFRCQHNLTYWHTQPYVGVGPAAASFTCGMADRSTGVPPVHRARRQGFSSPTASVPHLVAELHGQDGRATHGQDAHATVWTRRTNAADLEAYMSAISRGELPPSSSESLAGRPAMAEAVMLALRLIEGADRRELADRYGLDISEAFPQSVARYQAQGALAVTPTRVRIAQDYLFVTDTILADIIAEGNKHQ